MKKWISTLVIFLLPMALFTFFSANSNNNDIATNGTTAIAAGKPVVYKFSSTLCTDCQQLEKIMKNIVPEYQDKIDFVSYKVDNPKKNMNEMIKKYNITLVPTMILIDKNGKDKLKIEGLVSEKELKKHFEDLVNE